MSDQGDAIRKKKIKEAYREAVTNFTTDSGIHVKNVYTPKDISDVDFQQDIGLPGQYPFTRGHHPLMYRGKLWNIAEISGLSTPVRFNERLQFLVEQGVSALNWELDGPTLYGIEPDQPMAEGQLGVCGVTLHTLRDVETLSSGLPLDELNLSCDAFYPDVWQSYILAAKKKGFDISKLRGVGGALYYYGPSVMPSRMDWLIHNGGFSTLARWGNDFCEYVYKNFPKWNFWYMSAADMQEAGGNAVHEVAFAIAVRNEMIREMLRRGLDINTIGSRLSPVFCVNRDFFEEIAKIRAARRIWAKTMKEDFGATDPSAMCLRLHVALNGSNFTRQQPLVNIARGAISTLAAVLAGSMGVQTPSFDEAWATPTEEAVRLAIRTQQVIRYESGVARVADPLGGSYYVESLTSELEERIHAMVQEIEEMGGWMKVLASGWVHEQLKEGILEIQKKVESGERPVIGVNRFQMPPEEDFKPELYAPDTSDVETYLADYKKFKEKRNKKHLREKIKNLQKAASDPGKNLVPYVFEALEADATFPEIIGVMRMNDGLDYDWAGERDFPF
jgi:methylmalonyl-CoA mutase N-terminal domain/subunit